LSLVVSASVPHPASDGADSLCVHFSRPSLFHPELICFFFRRLFPYQSSRLNLVASTSLPDPTWFSERALFSSIFLVLFQLHPHLIFLFFRRFFPYQRSRLRLVASASLPDPTSDSADSLGVHFSRPSFSSVSSVPLICRLLQFTVVNYDRTAKSVWDQVASTACLHWTLFLFGFYSLVRIRRMGEKGKSVRIVRYTRLIRGCTTRRVETRRGGLVEKMQQPALSDCKDFFLGQSEPAPTNASVGRSVHRMGCIFSSSLNQSTFFGFWPMSFFFGGGCFFLNPDLDSTFPPSYPADLVILLTQLPY
jgi:hypothetical protein